ncbi:MAG: hypothetical protein HND53_06700 [Proteobacteria bacterium]|nr:hypothetical protein [Pseudomonadota bacterium]NOG60173.1 hypothetical protein [Pseudomonadota bacterium]
MYKFDNNNEEEAKTSQPAMSSLNETSKDIFSIVVRLCGLMLLFIGLWIAIQVFSEALALYKDPTNIERIATAIEAGSNIDKSIVPIRDSLLGEDEDGAETEIAVKAKENKDGFRISYFIAWVVDLLLLLLLARIALMAIKTGGELALYDAQIKRFARQIVKANKE